jgi:transposase-like protein
LSLDTTENGGAFTRRWHIAAAQLASGANVAEAAKACGRSDRQIYRWLRRPAFQRLLQETRDAVFSAAIGKLTESCGAAADTLRKLLDNPNPMVQLGAARALIGAAVKGREAVDDENRIRELEEMTAKHETRARGL